MQAIFFLGGAMHTYSIAKRLGMDGNTEIELLNLTDLAADERESGASAKIGWNLMEENRKNPSILVVPHDFRMME
ncbi:hypothetical protein [Burkholderia territorii]|uniref:hypothetical protein n=1 Tax=Burkholderia territorii TaxID=1503055 RepID=UPI0012D9785D|nr:hypothetical protein [Burkholderia territorii]